MDHAYLTCVRDVPKGNFLLPSRVERRQPQGMAPADISKITRELEARGPTRRSALHKWLLTNHAKLAPQFDSPRCSWVNAAELLAAEGLVGATGKPASPKALRQMWLRVTRDVARAREEVAATRGASSKPARSRPQNNWQPPLAIAAAPVTPTRVSDDWLPAPISAKTPVVRPGMERQPASDDEVKTRLAELRRTFAERSGH